MKSLDRLVTLFSWGSALLLVSGLAAILGHIAARGAGMLGRTLFFGGTPAIDALLLRQPVFDGLFPAVAGTLVLVCCSVALALPPGIAAGIYMAEYAGGWLKKLFDLFFDILAGVPSVVIGLFGFAVAVLLHRYVSRDIGPCLLVSSLALALLVLPYVIRTTQGALEGLPAQTRLTALALGASRFQNIRLVLLPRALNGILTGVILSVGRCAEDTAVILLTGVVASAGIPRSLLEPYEALPFYIYYISAQYTSPAELDTGYGAALVLLSMCVGLFALASFIKRRLSHNLLYRA